MTATRQLFPKTEHRKFMEISISRYNNMVARLERKSIPVPFGLSQFREWLRNELKDGIKLCSYCNAVYVLEDLSIDHDLPLERGGPADLANLRLICDTCNRAKGIMLPAEFRLLRRFLREIVPVAENDVLRRLAEHPKLLAKQRYLEVRSRIAAGKNKRKTAPKDQLAIDDF